MLPLEIKIIQSAKSVVINEVTMQAECNSNWWKAPRSDELLELAVRLLTLTASSEPTERIFYGLIYFTSVQRLFLL